MKKLITPLFLSTLFLFSACTGGDSSESEGGLGDIVEDVFDGDYFHMTGNFDDGVYTNVFEVESRYWPSFMMVIPENTDLQNEKFEAVAIFDDYGIANETYPVGKNISFFQQDGSNADRKTLVEVEDDDITLYLDDANQTGIAYSFYDERMDMYDVYYYDIHDEESKMVASGDVDKLNSFASVVGDKIYWTEIDGDDFAIYSDGIGYEKEEVIYQKNAWGVLLESHGDYLVYFLETYTDDYEYLTNDVIIYDLTTNEISQSVEVDMDYEVLSGNYDGENIFITAYDYENYVYVNAEIDHDGMHVVNEEDDFVTTFTGAGSKNFLMKAQEYYHGDFYEAEYLDIHTGEEESFSDLLNAGIYNNYFFYIECDVNTDQLINELTLVLEEVN
ncbi:MAG: hypothetical protein ACPG4Z_04660 [Chitinophagales bacterium]